MKIKKSHLLIKVSPKNNSWCMIHNVQHLIAHYYLYLILKTPRWLFTIDIKAHTHRFVSKKNDKESIFYYFCDNNHWGWKEEKNMNNKKN